MGTEKTFNNIRLLIHGKLIKFSVFYWCLNSLNAKFYEYIENSSQTWKWLSNFISMYSFYFICVFLSYSPIHSSCNFILHFCNNSRLFSQSSKNYYFTKQLCKKSDASTIKLISQWFLISTLLIGMCHVDWKS